MRAQVLQKVEIVFWENWCDEKIATGDVEDARKNEDFMPIKKELGPSRRRWALAPCSQPG